MIRVASPRNFSVRSLPRRSSVRIGVWNVTSSAMRAAIATGSLLSAATAKRCLVMPGLLSGRSRGPTSGPIDSEPAIPAAHGASPDCVMLAAGRQDRATATCHVAAGAGTLPAYRLLDRRDRQPDRLHEPPGREVAQPRKAVA